MTEPTEKGSGFPGERHVVLAAPVIATALRQKPLLRRLLVTRAGFFPKAAGHLRRRPKGLDEAILIYCVNGSGWCELAGRRHPVRKGELAVLPPGVPHAYGASTSNPWTIHWVHVVGDHLRAYLAELGTSEQAPVIWVGEDMQVTHLFGEIETVLQSGVSFLNLLHASETLAHLLALCIRHRHERARGKADAAQKVAQAIEFMSDRLDQPLRIPDLAALANVSKAHFAVLFKKQTGTSPRGYLQLLRIHRACQLLHTPGLSIKEIAAQVGFQDPLYFSRWFRRLQGVSPTEYRLRKGG